MSSARPLPEALLLDYAAGAASPPIGLLMATHLSMSEESRALFATMEAIGGAFLEGLDGEPLERISAADALSIAEGDQGRDPGANGPVPAPSMARAGAPSSFAGDELPSPLRMAEEEVGGDRGWRWLGLGVAATKLAVSTGHERAHLLWAKGGTGIMTHRHVGREVVLVLKGAFWDDGVRYGPGDVAISEDGTVHSPKIDQSEDCICLAVTEAPIHFTGLAGLVLNRFCRF